jgi:hypothetical protein
MGAATALRTKRAAVTNTGGASRAELRGIGATRSAPSTRWKAPRWDFRCWKFSAWIEEVPLTCQVGEFPALGPAVALRDHLRASKFARSFWNFQRSVRVWRGTRWRATLRLGGSQKFPVAPPVAPVRTRRASLETTHCAQTATKTTARVRLRYMRHHLDEAFNRHHTAASSAVSADEMKLKLSATQVRGWHWRLRRSDSQREATDTIARKGKGPKRHNGNRRGNGMQRAESDDVQRKRNKATRRQR